MGESPDGPGGGEPRPIALAPLTVLELGPVELVECAADAGFDAVGLRLIPATPQEPRRPTVGDTALVRQTRRVLDDSGLLLVDIEVLRLRPDTRVRADYTAVLETGAHLGATEVLVTGNDPDHHRVADNLAELAVLAAQYGLTPSLEPMPWTDVTDLAAAAAIVERSGDSGVGLLVDAIHYHRAGNTPDDIAALPSRRLRYAQICDAPAARPDTVAGLMRQGRTARLLPGDGAIDLTGMLRALPAGIPISVEAPVEWAAPAADRARAAYLAARRVLDPVDGAGRAASRRTA